MVKKAVNGGKNPADQPTGFGSVSGVPNLHAGFVQTFKSRFVNVDGLHLHAVIGGGGPPLLLLLGGWPQIWYSWRFVMPALAKDFAVIAVDPRGVGLSDKPAKGYDLATLARDIFGLMTELGYERFAMAGHDMSGIGDDFYRMNGAGEMLVFSAADFEDWLKPRPDLSPLMEDALKAVIRLLLQNR